MDYSELRDEVVNTVRAMNAAGINQGTAGNVSVRIPQGFLITPTGLSYERMRPQDIVQMHMDGSIPPGQLRPSSEWRFHRDILVARENVAAVIHAHPIHATALACVRRSIPAFHYMVAVAGGDSIRCAPYATFGTQELSMHAVTALKDRYACLLANHGMIAIGASLTDALARAIEVETLAQQYCQVLQIGGAVVLDEAEMARVLEKFKTYGQYDVTDPV